MEKEMIDRALKEPKFIEEIVRVCDESETDYVTGIIIYYNLDPEEERYDPLYLLYDILTEKGEMSEREAMVLIHNSVQAVIRGMLDIGKDDEDDGVE